MQLYFAPTSPFARKVRLAARELGLDARIEEIEVDPWTDASLRSLNPLAKVPTLVTDDGQVLFESAVICEYLDHLAGGRLFPLAGPARWRALRLQGAADGACTAAGRLYADEHRPADQRSTAMMGRLAQAVDATLDALEVGDRLADEPGIGELAVFVLLDYLDFRWPQRDWRCAHPALAAWHARMAQRPAFRATAFRLPAAR